MSERICFEKKAEERLKAECWSHRIFLSSSSLEKNEFCTVMLCGVSCLGLNDMDDHVSILTQLYKHQVLAHRP